MAKSKIELDDEFKIDDYEIGDGIGDETLPPPKNKLEAMTRVIKKSGTYIKTESSSNRAKHIADIIEDTLPYTIMADVNDTRNAIGNIRDEYKEALEDVKKSGASFLESIEPLVNNPTGSRIIGKLKDKLRSNNYDDLGTNEEAERDSAIAREIDETFANNAEQNMSSVVREQMGQNIQRKQVMSLYHIHNEMLKQNAFNNNTTNKYYRRSLELQYKHLFVAQDQYKLTKHTFDTFKKQLEAIVYNSSLPEYSKVPDPKTQKQKLKQYFKRVSGIEQLETQIRDSIKTARYSMIDALSMGEMSASMRDKPLSVGEALGRFGLYQMKKATSGIISSKLKKNKKFAKGIFAFENAAMDPIGSIKNLISAGSNKLGPDSALHPVLDFLNEIIQNNTKNTIGFKRNDLNAASAFDGRTHSSINKIIPGYLSKILNELTTIRTKGKFSSSNELRYDHKQDSFVTKKTIKENFVKDTQYAFATNIKYDMEKLTDSIGIKATDKKYVAGAIVQYVLDGNSIAPDQLLKSTNNILTYVPVKYRKNTKIALVKYINKIKMDPIEYSKFRTAIQNIKYNAPSMEDEIQELFNSGMGGVVRDMGLSKYNRYNDTENIDGKIYGKFGSDQYMSGADKYNVVRTKDGKNIVSDLFNGVMKNVKGDPRDRLKPTAFATTTKRNYGKRTNKADGIIDNIVANNSSGNRNNRSGKSKLRLVTSDKEMKILVDDYHNSEAYKTGAVNDFEEFLEPFGLTADRNNLEVVMREKIRENVTKAAQDIYNKKAKDKVDAVKERLKYKKLTPEEDEVMRDKFLNSNAYKNGNVTSYEKYCNTYGKTTYGVKDLIKGFLRRTRALDKKIVKGIFKYGVAKPLKALTIDPILGMADTAMAPFRYARNKLMGRNDPLLKRNHYVGRGIRGVGRAIKGTAKLVSSGPLSLLGLDPYGIDQEEDTISKVLKKTRSVDNPASIAKNTIKRTGGLLKGAGNILGKLGKGGINTLGFLGSLIGLGDKEKKPKADTTHKKTAVDIFDGFSNDKQRAGDGIARLDKLDKLKKDKDGSKLIKDAVKDDNGKGSSMSFLMGAIGLGISAIKNIIGGFTKPIGAILNALLWFKNPIGLLKDIAVGIGKLPGLLGRGAGMVAGAAGAVWNAGKAAVIGTKNAIVKGAKYLYGLSDDMINALRSKMGPLFGKAMEMGKKLVGKVKSGLNLIKTKLGKKLGQKAAKVLVAKVVAKAAGYLVAGVGTALLLYDAGMIAYDMIQNKTPFMSAVSKQILGFDVFDGDTTSAGENSAQTQSDNNAKTQNAGKTNSGAGSGGGLPNNNTNNDTTKDKNKPKSIVDYIAEKTEEYAKLLKDKAGNVSDKIGNYWDEFKQSAGDTIKDITANIGGGNIGSLPGGNISVKGKMFTATIGKGFKSVPNNFNGNIKKLVGDSNTNFGKADPNALKALAAMNDEFMAKTGKPFLVNSAWRSTQEQIVVYNRALAKYGAAKVGSYAARPGYSRHEYGLAFDIHSPHATMLFKMGLLSKYGFARTVIAEVWHIEYMTPGVGPGAYDNRSGRNIPKYTVPPEIAKAKVAGDPIMAYMGSGGVTSKDMAGDLPNKNDKAIKITTSPDGKHNIVAGGGFTPIGGTKINNNFGVDNHTTMSSGNTLNFGSNSGGSGPKSTIVGGTSVTPKYAKFQYDMTDYGKGPIESGPDYVKYPNGAIKKGGSKSWRNNNPGNITGMSGTLYGAIGHALNPRAAAKGDRDQLVFSSVKEGFEAMRTMINSKYKGPIRETFAKYQESGFSQKLNDWIAHGIDINKTFQSLSVSIQDLFLKIIAKWEGYKPGTITKGGMLLPGAGVMSESKSSYTPMQSSASQYPANVFGGTATNVSPNMINNNVSGGGGGAGSYTGTVSNTDSYTSASNDYNFNRTQASPGVDTSALLKGINGSNKTLNTISDTLLKSYNIQKSMLDRLTEISSKIDGKPGTEVKVTEKKTKTVDTDNLPPPIIGLERKKHVA